MVASNNASDQLGTLALQPLRTYVLDALSYGLIKPTHVMSESKFHAESYGSLVVFITVTNHCNIKDLGWHLSLEV